MLLASAEIATHFNLRGAPNGFMGKAAGLAVMPIIGLVTPAVDWKQWFFTVGSQKFLIGDFFGAVVDFGIANVLTHFLDMPLARRATWRLRRLRANNRPNQKCPREAT